MKSIDLDMLFAKLKEGDKNAQAFFYYSYRPLLESFLRRYTREVASAQLMANDAFFMVMCDIAKIKNEKQFLHLLYSTAWKLFIQGGSNPDGGPGMPNDADLLDKDRMVIFQYLPFLPPRKQEITILRFVHHLSCNAIAEQLSIKPQTVRNHISQSRIRLCKLFPMQQAWIDFLFWQSICR